jgi:hypothetical protein
LKAVGAVQLHHPRQADRERQLHERLAFLEAQRVTQLELVVVLLAREDDPRHQVPRSLLDAEGDDELGIARQRAAALDGDVPIPLGAEVGFDGQRPVFEQRLVDRGFPSNGHEALLVRLRDRVAFPGDAHAAAPPQEDRHDDALGTESRRARLRRGPVEALFPQVRDVAVERLPDLVDVVGASGAELRARRHPRRRRVLVDVERGDERPRSGVDGQHERLPILLGTLEEGRGDARRRKAVIEIELLQPLHGLRHARFGRRGPVLVSELAPQIRFVEPEHPPELEAIDGTPRDEPVHQPDARAGVFPRHDDVVEPVERVEVLPRPPDRLHRVGSPDSRADETDHVGIGDGAPFLLHPKLGDDRPVLRGGRHADERQARRQRAHHAERNRRRGCIEPTASSLRAVHTIRWRRHQNVRLIRTSIA